MILSLSFSFAYAISTLAIAEGSSYAIATAVGPSRCFSIGASGVPWVAMRSSVFLATRYSMFLPPAARSLERSALASVTVMPR